jgi:hypothetical protein
MCDAAHQDSYLGGIRLSNQANELLASRYKVSADMRDIQPESGCTERFDRYNMSIISRKWRNGSTPRTKT